MAKLGKYNKKYTENISKIITHNLRLLLKANNWSECICNVKQHYTNNTINRRLKRLIRVNKNGIFVNKCNLGPNLKGPKNKDTITVEFIDRHNSNTLVVLWSLSCHPVGFYNKNVISADFPGKVRSKLREKNKNIPVLYLQGISGDIRPPSIKKTRSIKDLFIKILHGRLFKNYTKEEWKLWSELIISDIIDTINNDYITLNGDLSSNRIEIPLSKIATNGKTDKTIALQLIKISNLSILGISAELLSGYLEILKKYYINNILLPITCIDNVFGYLPTQEEIDLLGYEIIKSKSLFNIDWDFRSYPESIIEKYLDKIIDK